MNTKITGSRILATTVAFAAALISLPEPGFAQDVNFARLEPGSRRIHISLGLDPALVTTTGFSHAITIGGRVTLLDADLGMGVAETDPRDLRARVGFLTKILQRGSWLVTGRGRLIARHTENSVYEGAGFSGDFTTTAGLYRPRWFAATLIGYDRTVITRIEHSDWYRTYFYEDAVDGWYRGDAGILHGGIVAGLAFGPVELALRVEWRRLDGGETLDPPIVGGLTVSVPF